MYLSTASSKRKKWVVSVFKRDFTQSAQEIASNPKERQALYDNRENNVSRGNDRGEGCVDMHWQIELIPKHQLQIIFWNAVAPSI